MKERNLARIHLLAQDAGLSVAEVDAYLTPLYKKDRLEKIYDLSREAGLSIKDIHDYLSEKEGDVALNADVEIVPGMFVYEDNKFSKGLIPHRQVKAVVAYVLNRTVYAICLKEELLPWSSTDLEVKETQQVTDGREATEAILRAAQKNEEQVEAAQWCHDYAEDGVKQGEAFLPSVEELAECCENITVIDAAFDVLGEESPQYSDLWTSNEDYDDHAWSHSLSLPDGRAKAGSHFKTDVKAVRAMLAIKI